jgi:hypothetical protein
LPTFWQRLTDGQLARDELPEAIDLSDIGRDMNDLVKETNEKRIEHGACIVLNSDGRLQLVHKVRGTCEEVAPDNGERCYRQKQRLGFFHTHLLFTPDGVSQEGFSDKDFIRALEDG